MTTPYRDLRDASGNRLFCPMTLPSVKSPDKADREHSWTRAWHLKRHSALVSSRQGILVVRPGLTLAKTARSLKAPTPLPSWGRHIANLSKRHRKLCRPLMGSHDIASKCPTAVTGTEDSFGSCRGGFGPVGWHPLGSNEVSIRSRCND